MLTVIYGPMFAGKSKKLLEKLKRETYRKQKFILFKPDKDKRYSDVDVVTHDGQKEKSIVVKSSREILECLANENDAFSVIGIDEAQFFDNGIIEVCDKLALTKTVIVAGLNLDSFGQPLVITKP